MKHKTGFVRLGEFLELCHDVGGRDVRECFVSDEFAHGEVVFGDFIDDLQIQKT